MQKQDFSLATVVNWHSRYIVILWFYWQGSSDCSGLEHLIDSVTNEDVRCRSKWWVQYSNPSIYKWSVYELMVIPESQINTYFSIC